MLAPFPPPPAFQLHFADLLRLLVELGLTRTPVFVFCFFLFFLGFIPFVIFFLNISLVYKSEFNSDWLIFRKKRTWLENKIIWVKCSSCLDFLWNPPHLKTSSTTSRVHPIGINWFQSHKMDIVCPFTQAVDYVFMTISSFAIRQEWKFLFNCCTRWPLLNILKC